MVLNKRSKDWVTLENTDSFKQCVALNLDYEQNMTVDKIQEDIKESTKTANDKLCSKEVREQKLNQRTKILM